jgi:hypothetical protein
MLAQHAEEPGDGLLNMVGGGWDTIGVAGIPDEASEVGAGIQIPLPGRLVARIRWHRTEMGRQRPWRLTILDMDGQEIAQTAGTLDLPEVDPDLPVHWDSFANLIIDLPPWLPLPHDVDEVLYSFSLQIDEAHVGDVPLRIKRD